MAAITQEERKIKREVLGKCWKYIRDNFHKFNDDKKLKVALDLMKKDIPTETKVTGDLVAKIVLARPEYDGKEDKT